MHRSLSSLAMILAALTLAACAPELGSSNHALTTDDVDIAPECRGILDYASEATVDQLDAVLPRATAEAVVARRGQSPLTSLADLLAVPGVGPARVTTIATAARAAGFLDDSCAGVVENLALSTDDEAALLAFANQATSDQLAVEVSSARVVAALLAGRPFASTAAIAAVPGVGPATFRALRNAAVAAAHAGPLEQLAAAIAERDRGVTLATRFDWRTLISDDRSTGRLVSAICFGIDEDLLVPGTTIRPELATGAEVHDAIAGAVRWANRSGDLSVDPALGLADLADRTAGRTFAGCYLRHEPDPWSGINRQFFLDAASGVQVFSEVRWSE